MSQDRIEQNLLDPGALAPQARWGLADWLATAEVSYSEFVRLSQCGRVTISNYLNGKGGVTYNKAVSRAHLVLIRLCREKGRTPPTSTQFLEAINTDPTPWGSVNGIDRHGEPMPGGEEWTLYDWMAALDLRARDFSAEFGRHISVLGYSLGNLAAVHRFFARRAYQLGRTGPTIPQVRVALRLEVERPRRKSRP